MALASVSMNGSSGTNLEFEDYSLYSNLSDEELMHLAIERSLADVSGSANPGDNVKTPVAQSRTYSATRQPAAHHTNPQYTCTANPPASTSTNEAGTTVSHFVTGNGRSMVGYGRVDGTFQVVPEAKEEPEPIVKAIWKGDVMAVRAIVNQPGIHLLQPNKYGWIPLHEAAYYGQEQCLQILLGAQPGMINKKTLNDQTALLLAVSMEELACVQRLLEAGADPDISNKERETPLYRACEKENVGIVAMLLNYGATVNKPCIQGWTALHETVSRNNMECCEMLVKAGAKLSPTNMYGITPLFVAAQSGCVEAMRFLMKHGADVNSEAGDGATALYEACKCGHEEVVELLLSQKADTNKAGKTGLLPIHIAAQRGHKAIVSMLIPATSKARVRRSGISPLHLAAERDRDEILELLIEADFDVNAMLSGDRATMYEDRRSTALYFAVYNNNIEAATMLLKAGANPNLDTFNTLLVAVRQGCIKMVPLLVEHGANVNAYLSTHSTSFPATVMFSMKYLPMLKYLMDNGGDALSCFNCVYGDKPHPPIKTERYSRDELRYGENVRRPNTSVQFCEVISTPAICRWAGPIIDVLLDYVGNVKLCSRLIEHLDSYNDWACIKEKSMPPRPLMHLCRLKISQQVGLKRLRCIQKLPLPLRLINFLNHDDRSQENCI